MSLCTSIHVSLCECLIDMWVCWFVICVVIAVNLQEAVLMVK